jgi:hypothetical protein
MGTGALTDSEFLAVIDLAMIIGQQIDGCPFYLDMRSKDDRHRGEYEQRLYLLPWRSRSEICRHRTTLLTGIHLSMRAGDGNGSPTQGEGTRARLRETRLQPD